jgi:hypothetical protein
MQGSTARSATPLMSALFGLLDHGLATAIMLVAACGLAVAGYNRAAAVILGIIALGQVLIVIPAFSVAAELAFDRLTQGFADPASGPLVPILRSGAAWQILGVALWTCAAAIMAAPTGRLRPFALAVVATTVIACGAYLYALVHLHFAVLVQITLVPAAALFALLCVATLRPSTPELAYLLIHAAVLLAAIMQSQTVNDSLHDSYFVIARLGNGGSALVIFMALAAWWRWMQPRLPDWMAFAHAAALTLALVAASSPETLLGRAAMPRRYSDYDQAIELLSRIAQSAAIAVVVLTVGGFFLIWQRRRNQART